MENTISVRIYDFLKHYPPFSLIDEETLMRIAQRVLVKYSPPDSYVFKQGEAPGKYIYIVKEGAVQLIREEEEGSVLIEQCDEGDVFGIRPLLAVEPYELSAKVMEESLIYAVEITGFEELLQKNPNISFYLARNFASGIRASASETYRGKLFLRKQELQEEEFSLTEVQQLNTKKAPITCLLNTSIQEAARKMTAQRVGSIIVVDLEQCPIGIVTDKDLRRKVATGLTPLNAMVSKIMSSPVRTLAPAVSYAEVQMEMVKHRIHHICITEDGTASTRVVGVVSEHDLLVVQGNNPAILIRSIQRARNAERLRAIRDRAEELMRKYLYQEVSIAFISEVITEINDALIQQVILLSQEELKQEGLAQPEAKFCWMTLGSEGRGEQLLRTDQDNALVFENVPESAYEATKSYYLQLSQKVTQKLHIVGFEYCPGEMMASNPKWCLSLQEWLEQFDKWIYEPTGEAVLFSSIFFDYRAVYGQLELAEQMTAHIFESIDERTMFLSFLAKSALRNPPPLTFFRNFVLEGSGDHKNEFDIKARAMMPLADAARVLILSKKVGQVNNTFRRFEKMAELEPNNKELFEQAADAYEILMRYRALQGIKNHNSGRYFNPSNLSKMERINLRNSFQPIRELQSLLNVRFQLAFLG
ncbi:MAG: DUF294 nucleotidyltransferase-like domain-containing protein [Bacteroidota bacterium]